MKGYFLNFVDNSSQQSFNFASLRLIYTNYQPSLFIFFTQFRNLEQLNKVKGCSSCSIINLNISYHFNSITNSHSCFIGYSPFTIQIIIFTILHLALLILFLQDIINSFEFDELNLLMRCNSRSSIGIIWEWRKPHSIGDYCGL